MFCSECQENHEIILSFIFSTFILKSSASIISALLLLIEDICIASSSMNCL